MDNALNARLGRLVEKAEAITSEIKDFLKVHKVTNPLPRATNILFFPPVQEPTSSVYSEEEEDELAAYLATTFGEIRSLAGHDPASLIRDTVQFVVNHKTTKPNTGMVINVESSVDDVYEWLIKKGVSQEISQIFRDNEIDGFSLLFLKDEDIFRMLPGKVGPARKIIMYIEKEQVLSTDPEVRKDPEVQKEKTMEKTDSNKADQEAIAPESNKMTTDTVEKNSEAEFSNATVQGSSSKTEDVYSQDQNYADPSTFIPAYSPMIKDLLIKEEIFKEWDKFIEETAYFILSRPAKFESRGLYADFGRIMYQNYPCIGHQAYGEPWGYFNKKLSQKIRNIRWKWNARGKTNTSVKKKKIEPEIKMIEKSMSLTDAGKIFRIEMEKPQKEIDRALVLKALRGSFKERRMFITKKHDGNLKELLKKLPVLGKAEYVEKEFFLMKPNVKKEDIADNWTETLSHLDRTFKSEHELEEEDVSVPDAAEELQLLKQLEQKVSFFHKGKSGKNPLMMIIKPAEMKTIPNKSDDPPRLIFVQGSTGTGVCNAFIIGGGVQMEVPSDIKDAFTYLLYTYYVWDLAYPKNYQILGFLQVYILKDRENKFAMSQNYLKFTKLFDDSKK
ncbi:uncharacterized protein LOC134276974 [Saccostrea cucullata]|uniref:uncharacterized protein LOC134276974 n=1 Tax=Saccostrea cuccullata TaxID=36930 RepID=UPI002ED5477A